MATSNKKKRSLATTLLIFAIELVVIGVLVFVGIKLFKGIDSDAPEGPSLIVIDKEELAINEEIAQKIEAGETKMTGYRTIALFGIDALDDEISSLYKGYRSDSIMLASINQETGDIKLCSVYRDTYLNLSNDSYAKCNAAYSRGGAKQSIAMLNMNLDLNIEDFVTVSYSALSKVIDGVGGIYIDVDEDEIKHINNYQIAIADILGTTYEEVTDTGYQKLNGIQAAAYCRIRYTAGSDFKRTERQREVLQAIEERAKKISVSNLLSLFDDVDQDIYTSLSKEDIVSLISDILKYSIVDEAGFPQRKDIADINMGSLGAVLAPNTLAGNVTWLHKFLYDEDDYVPSETVSKISSSIDKDIATYLG